MTVPFLPESAPFTPAQRAYLNGFFAGLLNVDPMTADASAAMASGGGTALAEPPADLIDEDDMPWHDPSLPMTDRMALTADKPAEFKFMAAMAQLDCGACGYMCRTYSKAIAEGKEADLTRCVPGGGETAKKLKQLVKEHPVALSVGGAAPESPAPIEMRYDRDNPFPAPILAIKRLTREGSGKDVRFVALDLTGSGITYNVGDALGVYPDNCTDLVDRILAAMKMTGNEPVAVGSRKLVPLREALTSHRTITRADEELANLLADAATDKKEAAELRELAKDDARMARFDLFDLVQEYKSVKVRPADLVATLPPLQPRLYSISSSQAACPNEVHLTVGVVRYELDGRPRRGVASTFFADRVHLGDTSRIFIHKAHAFAPPADGATPMIMVGPGTGIAPFRAFLQQRQADQARGDHWLFFGDQRQATDFLYEHELTQWLEGGLLTRLDLAFSRDSDEKVYVQHRMIEQGAAVWEWLERGAHFYICGDAGRMAADVDKALKQIVSEHGGMSAEDAAGYVAKLVEDGRYQRDVY
ncbi:MAG: sulfite reductase subunit alpha [Planctomycetes bacterium]|nr:sulfite reductase subunit alpha [Planctomycetota bacterium]